MSQAARDTARRRGNRVPQCQILLRRSMTDEVSLRQRLDSNRCAHLVFRPGSQVDIPARDHRSRQGASAGRFSSSDQHPIA